jgi:formate hydrogenlyase subunit 4
MVVRSVLRLLIAFGFTLTIVPGLIWLERRLLSWLQGRLGPNRVGPEGIAQPIADGIKLFFKEDIRPVMSDRLLYVVAPAISLFAALIAFAVVPIGPSIWIGETEVPLQVADLPVGVVYLLAASSLGVYGLVLGGWGVSSGGATTDATSPVPAGGAGIAACSRDRSRSLGAARTNATAASTASRPITGAAMREKRLPTRIPSARQRLS